MLNSSEKKRLFKFIENNRNENIPQKLYYEGCQTDKDKYGKTPLMLWIRYR